jgi:DNA-binding CsgD family transcriptional regulator/PAS domain-containing protein
MEAAVETEFLDLLYEAAVEPDKWIPAMERFADLVGGTSSWLSRLSMANGTGSGVVSRIDPVMPPLYHGYYAPQNLYSNATDPEAFMRGWTPKILVDDDFVPKEELVKTEYYDGFLKPQDVHSIMFVRLAARGVEISAISINRPESWGRFESWELERARRLHPHVRRAFRVAETLAEAGLMAEGMGAAMDRSPCGVIVLDDAGRIRRTNAIAEARLAEAGGVCVVAGRLSAVQPKVVAELQALISAAASPDLAVRTGGSMTLAVPGKRFPLSVTVAPVRSPAFAVFDHRPAVIVCINDPEAETQISEETLRALFGLTRAEARVAIATTRGGTARQVAATLGLSVHTVRNQLQSVLEKTGASRQSELVGLLMRVTRPRAV